MGILTRITSFLLVYNCVRYFDYIDWYNMHSELCLSLSYIRDVGGYLDCINCVNVFFLCIEWYSMIPLAVLH